MAMDQLQVSRWIWRSWLLLLLLLLPCLSPAFATLEQGVALREVKKSGWMSSVVVSHETWVVGTDPCVSVWEGVDCDTQGNVITLNLTNAGLRGPVPHALGRLTTLTHLDMGNNKICTNCSDWNRVTGDLAPVANLINLRFLCLTSNEMDLPNGPFPTAIYQLKQLIDLRIDNTEIGGEFPAQLATLHNLQYLYLGNNSFTGTIPRDIWASMMNLKELTMWGNQLTGLVPPELGNLVNLTYLNLNRNNLYGGLPPELGNLIHLKRLIMFRNKFTGPIPDAWRGMTSLENLQLNSNFVYGKLPSWLLQIPSLSFLELSINQIRGPIVPVLNYSTSPGLKTLFLQCNYFEGVRPKVEINITTNLEYNCWDNETLGDAACERILNCQSFILHTMNGNCPSCPIGQEMVNTTTCICHGVPKQSSKRQLGAGAIVGIFAGAVLLVSLVVASFLWRAKRQAKKQHQDPLLHPDYFQANNEGSLVKRASMSMEVPRGSNTSQWRSS